MRLASDILDLFSRVADGVQTEDDERRLIALLKTDAAAREEFQRVMELHSTLHWMYVTAAIRPQPRRRLAGPSQPTSASGWQKRWIAAALASFLLLGGVVGGIATRLVAGRQAAPAAATAPAPAAEDRASNAIGVIGMIEKARLVVPAAGGKAVRDGDPLHAGRLAIAAGVVELRLGNGVRIVLEGPGELELFGEMAAFLHAGKAVVRMPDGMKGFRLDTATTDVLDLGTEFAVKTGQGLVTDVQVYDGEVLATRKSGDAGMQFPKRLVAGEAVRFDAKNGGLPQPIPYSEGRFIRSVPSLPGVELPYPLKPEERIQQFGRMLFDAITVMPAEGPVTIDGSLEEWGRDPGFEAARNPDAADGKWAAGWMMYDAEHLYIGAHVGDPHPMQSVIDPELDPEDGWRGGGLQVRLSADRTMGWPADANNPSYYSARRLEPTEAERVQAENPQLSHLTMWHHAPTGRACLAIAQGMNLKALAVNPAGVTGAFRRDADGRGYVVEYAIPWRVLHAEDDPPRKGDRLAVAWQVHWSDAAGRIWQDQLVEIRNPHEPHAIMVWERAAAWGRAEFR